MRRVIVETPYRRYRIAALDDDHLNLRYLRAAMRDSFARGEAPFASHALYAQTGILNDDDDAERRLGMLAGFAWGEAAEATVVYVDLGISAGMQEGIKRARRCGRPVEQRSLAEWADKKRPAEAGHSSATLGPPDQAA